MYLWVSVKWGLWSDAAVPNASCYVPVGICEVRLVKWRGCTKCLLLCTCGYLWSEACEVTRLYQMPPVMYLWVSVRWGVALATAPPAGGAGSEGCAARPEVHQQINYWKKEKLINSTGKRKIAYDWICTYDLYGPVRNVCDASSVVEPLLFFTVPFRSDFWNVTVPVSVPVPIFDTLRFRFRIRI
jgi:hypothetical protein